jgi:hypothetical protein
MNLPFYALAVVQLGWRFTIKSLIAVSLMSALADAFPCFFTLGALPPWLGAVLFGVLAGAGLLALFRHGATLGGVGIVALWLQDRTGCPRGARSSSSTSASFRGGAVPVRLGNGGLVASGGGDPEPAHHDEPPARPLRGALVMAGPRLTPGPKLTTLRASSTKEPDQWPPRRPFPATSSSSPGATCARAAPRAV